MPSNKQPHKHRTYDARARMFLRDQMAWLWGYPINVTKNNIQWQVLYYPGPWDVYEIIIDGIEISKTIRSKNRLVRDFPKALPRVVGDVKQWSQLQEVKLSAIKKLLAQKTVDPWQEIISIVAPNRLLKQGKQLRSNHPSLATLIDAFAWSLSGDLKALQTALRWLDKNSASLILISDQYPNPTQLILALFYLEQKVRTKYVQPFVNTIANEDFINFFSMSGSAWELYAKSVGAIKVGCVENVLIIPQQKKQQTLESISVFIYSLNTLSVAQRRQSLILFSVLVNDNFLGYLRDYFDVVDVVRPLLKKMLFGHTSTQEYKQLEVHYLKRHKEIVLRYIPTIEAVQFFSLIQWLLTKNEIIPLLQKMGALLLPLKDLQTNRQDTTSQPWQHPMIMLHWVNFLKEIVFPDSLSHPIFQRGLNQYIADSTSLDLRLKRLSPWSKLLCKSSLNPHDKKQYEVSILGYHEQDFYISDSAGTASSLSNYFQLLGQLTDDCDEMITSKQAQSLFNFHSYSSLEHPVYGYYLEASKVRTSLKYLYLKEYKLLHKVAQGDPVLFGYCYKLWTVPNKPMADEDIDAFIWDDNRENGVEMLANLAALGYQQTALYHSQQQHYGMLKNTAGLVEVFSEIKLALPHPPGYLESQFPGWLTQYPDALNNGLFALIKYHSNAEKAANDILGNDFPTAEHLHNQIDYLQSQDDASETPRFNNRIQQLQNRINLPIKVGNTRLKKLDQKLHHAAHTALICNWHMQLETTLYQKIHHSFQQSGSVQIDDINPCYLKTLTALLPLNDKIRSQGYQLILSHAGYSQWDYYKEKRNQQFIQQLNAKGINTDLWLEQRSECFNKTINGKTVQLRLHLEQDILALFYMGSHFSTCLSHYDFNFFSVVANIIDINKQVIYAYDEKGKVQGRCLIALTDSGKILNYHYYSHYKNNVFELMANDYIDQLAMDMGTTRATKGYPGKLISHDWYDDVANDYRQLSIILDEASELDKKFEDIAAKDFLNELTKAIHPCKLSSTALGLIIYMGFFRKRPDLCLLLLNKVQSLPESSHEIRFEFASNLISIEQYDAAFSLLGKWYINYAIKRLKDWGWKVEEVLELLLAMSSSLTLRVLQKSRSSEVRNWQDESSGQRLYAAALAFYQLKRPNRALTLFKLALSVKGWGKLNENQKTFAKEKIKDLNNN